tara:strand:- start:10707 stop:10859 length:153 start_codon:yes stop_codon:yes gene_type:complete
MDINKNIKKLNEYLASKRICFADKLYIINIAKVSKNIEELKDNINWEKIR